MTPPNIFFDSPAMPAKRVTNKITEKVIEYRVGNLDIYFTSPKENLQSE